jgi:hypothetical protein
VDEVTPRAYISLVVGDLEQQRQIVAEALSKGKAVPIAAPLTSSTAGDGAKAVSFDFGWITASGALVVQSKKYNVILIQEPSISQGKVTWSCVVYPAEAKPKLCGSAAIANLKI